MLRKEVNKPTRWNGKNKLTNKNQALVNKLLKLKRDDPEITIQEMHYFALGVRSA